jgi:hypothetical protein
MKDNEMSRSTQIDKPWAVVSEEGKLIKFDSQFCHKLANSFEDQLTLDRNVAVARLCVALLDCAAAQVDHIYREGGGTYGDSISL